MIAAIIQARVGSTRLPNKIFSDLCGKPLLWHIINRIKYSKKIDHICIATTTNPKDDIVSAWANSNSIDVFRGSEDDVLCRYYESAKKLMADTIVRITADDPFKDPHVIDQVISLFIDEGLDFAFNNKPPSFPEGMDTEVFSYKALEKAYYESTDIFEKEHVTQYFYRNPSIFKQKNLAWQEDISYLRWTIDTKQDYEMTKKVYQALYKENEVFLMQDILDLIKKYPEIPAMNAEVTRSAMYKKQD